MHNYVKPICEILHNIFHLITDSELSPTWTIAGRVLLCVWVNLKFVIAGGKPQMILVNEARFPMTILLVLYWRLGENDACGWQAPN